MPIEFRRPEIARADKRRTSRRRILLSCSLRERGRSAVEAKISDLSAYGCRLGSFATPLAGNQMWVRLPGLESQSASVAWTHGNTAGASFDHPLHPAVIKRFIGADPDSEVPSSAPEGVVSGLDSEAMMTRREQIMQGVAANDHSPLTRRKVPKHGGIMAAISRQVIRTADHRMGERYRNFTEMGAGALEIGGKAARVIDVSSSGLRARVDFAPGIGSTLPVAFDGFDPIAGRVVWQRDGEIGFSLPPESFDLMPN